MDRQSNVCWQVKYWIIYVKLCRKWNHGLIDTDWLIDWLGEAEKEEGLRYSLAITFIHSCIWPFAELLQFNISFCFAEWRIALKSNPKKERNKMKITLSSMSSSSSSWHKLLSLASVDCRRLNVSHINHGRKNAPTKLAPKSFFDNEQWQSLPSRNARWTKQMEVSEWSTQWQMCETTE